MNCEIGELVGRQRHFCGDDCREFSKAVRWARRHGLTKINSDPELQLALNEKLRFIPLGGYRRFHHVTLAGRVKVIADALGKCSCGAPGTQIDHKGPARKNAFNQIENLQLLCSECHLQKTWGVSTADEWCARQKVLEPDPSLNALIDEFIRRVESVEPIKPCDDDKKWPSYIHEQRARKFHGESIWDGVNDAGQSILMELYERYLDSLRKKKSEKVLSSLRPDHSMIIRLDGVIDVINVLIDDTLIGLIGEQMSEYGITVKHLTVEVGASR